MGWDGSKRCSLLRLTVPTSRGSNPNCILLLTCHQETAQVGRRRCASYVGTRFCAWQWPHLVSITARRSSVRGEPLTYATMQDHVCPLFTSCQLLYCSEDTGEKFISLTSISSECIVHPLSLSFLDNWLSAGTRGIIAKNDYHFMYLQRGRW